MWNRLTSTNQVEGLEPLAYCSSIYSSNATKTIPGHGNIGGTELLDYTIQLFSDSTKLVP